MQIIQYCNGQILLIPPETLPMWSFIWGWGDLIFKCQVQHGQCSKTVFTFLNMKECSMIWKPAKFKSTIKNPSIWAIDQLCTMKIVGSATVFLLLGALVPWSPGTQAEYLSFQWSKWAWEKNLRKNLWFRTTFVFYSILKSQVWSGT